ncbi:hypothetical protein [Maricaulis sp.]|uniref:hypothetical protein n=1 Tax=Maricaulis sp. TaxID=1486257 RepID=UPI003A93A00D
MKKPFLTMMLAGSAMLVAGAVAQAQPGRGGHDGPGRHGGGQGGGMMMLHLADANGDGSVTRAEVDALQAEMFEWKDRNGDGYLDAADQSPVRQRMRAMHEARADEAADQPDGEERRSMRRGHRGERGDQAERGDRGDRAERGGRGGRGGRGDAGLRRADTDDDQRISRAEFLAMERPGFDRLDQDSDGVITPAELDAAADARHDRRRWWRN